MNFQNNLDYVLYPRALTDGRPPTLRLTHEEWSVTREVAKLNGREMYFDDMSFDPDYTVDVLAALKRALAVTAQPRPRPKKKAPPAPLKKGQLVEPLGRPEATLPQPLSADQRALIQKVVDFLELHRRGFVCRKRPS